MKMNDSHDPVLSLSVPSGNASDLRRLSDSELHERTLRAVAIERQATHHLLEHLKEVARRHLFADYGYPSLFDYCTKALKLSEGSANRRINALRLTEEVPSVEAKIISGSISLSVASHAQSFFRKEGKLLGKRLEPGKKEKILESLEGLSLEDASRKLLSISVRPEQHYSERVRPISPELTELKLAITPEQRELFERVRGLIAHQQGEGVSWSELFEKMARVTLEKLDPAREPSKRKRKADSRASEGSSSGESSRASASADPQRAASPIGGENLAATDLASGSLPPRKIPTSSSPTPTPISTPISTPTPTQPPSTDTPPAALRKESRHLPATLKRRIWQRDQGKCRNCGSHYAVQGDHIQDWAFGGETREDNLQLLCRSCHRRKTFRTHGEHKR